MQDKEQKYVMWQTFAWSAGIVSLLIFGSYALANSAYNMTQETRLDVRELQTQYTSIRADLGEIKDILKSR